MSSGLYLSTYLAPLAPWLSRDDVTDLLVNQPGEVWVEDTQGGFRCEPAEDLTEAALLRLARQIAAHAHQGLSREHPLLSASLPDGARVQIVTPPATRRGVVMAIRKHVLSDLSLSELDGRGLFSLAATPPSLASADEKLMALQTAGLWREFLQTAVVSRKTIVISGGAGAGKTTLLNALVKEVPPSERLIVVEDAPEILLARANSVGLVAVRGEQGEARIGQDDLLRAALRMRPDRVLLGELRGPEALGFLQAASSGHPGSISTVHADSPEKALDQIALLALTSGLDLGWSQLQTLVRSVVDIVVQIERRAGKRQMSQVWMRPSVL